MDFEVCMTSSEGEACMLCTKYLYPVKLRSELVAHKRFVILLSNSCARWFSVFSQPAPPMIRAGRKFSSIHFPVVWSHMFLCGPLQQKSAGHGRRIAVFLLKIEKRQLWVRPIGAWNSTLQAVFLECMVSHIGQDYPHRGRSYIQSKKCPFRREENVYQV